MTTPLRIAGRYQSARPIDSRTLARCLGTDCEDGVSYCPKHQPYLYAGLASRHMRDAS